MKFYTAEEYLPKVLSIFEHVSRELKETLNNFELEHIGSSAIHGAISKGDLDILVKVSASSFEEALEKIKTLGFYEKQGTLRTACLCMLSTDRFNHDVAIQLIVKNSEFEMFVEFKDKLNQNPRLVDEYNLLKQNSIDLTPEDYRKKKSLFIDSVLNGSKKY